MGECLEGTGYITLASPVINPKPEEHPSAAMRNLQPPPDLLFAIEQSSDAKSGPPCMEFYHHPNPSHSPIC